MWSDPGKALDNQENPERPMGEDRSDHEERLGIVEQVHAPIALRLAVGGRLEAAGDFSAARGKPARHRCAADVSVAGRLRCSGGPSQGDELTRVAASAVTRSEYGKCREALRRRDGLRNG